MIDETNTEGRRDGDEHHVRVHLVTGAAIDGGSTPMTDDEVDEVKDSLSGLLKSSEGWQLSVTLPNGDWACIPKHGVLYVELVRG